MALLAIYWISTVLIGVLLTVSGYASLKHDPHLAALVVLIPVAAAASVLILPYVRKHLIAKIALSPVLGTGAAIIAPALLTTT